MPVGWMPEKIVWGGEAGKGDEEGEYGEEEKGDFWVVV